MSASEWIPDLARRLSQGITAAVQHNLGNVEVWLGGLFFPGAYTTATRQAVAHRKQWSLKTLHLRLDIGQMNDPGAFIADGTLSFFCRQN
jgi:dynein heavy chain 1